MTFAEMGLSEEWVPEFQVDESGEEDVVTDQVTQVTKVYKRCFGTMLKGWIDDPEASSESGLILERDGKCVAALTYVNPDMQDVSQVAHWIDEEVAFFDALVHAFSDAVRGKKA